jgi:cytochrome c553
VFRFKSATGLFARALIAWLVCAGAWLGTARAQQPPLAPLSIEGDPARGKTLAYTCLGCHGVESYVNVYPTYQVPKIGGQNADYLEVALQGYRRGSRGHQTMQAQASSLSDQDIADIAAYFSGLGGDSETGKYSADMAELAAGRNKASACAVCHGANGIAETSQWPDLAGQHASYIEQAMHEYKSGTRADMVMGPMMADLDAESMAEIAAFFAAQPGPLAAGP